MTADRVQELERDLPALESDLAARLETAREARSLARRDPSHLEEASSAQTLATVAEQLVGEHKQELSEARREASEAEARATHHARLEALKVLAARRSALRNDLGHELDTSGVALAASIARVSDLLELDYAARGEAERLLASLGIIRTVFWQSRNEPAREVDSLIGSLKAVGADTESLFRPVFGSEPQLYGDGKQAPLPSEHPLALLIAGRAHGALEAKWVQASLER
jgi:hypothetical protein